LPSETNPSDVPAPQPIRRLGKGRRALRWIGGAVYTVVACEIFIRVFAPQPILPRYVVATSYGIRGNEPNRSYWQQSSEYKVQIRVNSKGVRADREIPYEKPDGVKRIVVLGDSFGMGYEVDLKETFLAVMERELAEAGLKVEVVNCSVSGHGNAEELITLREEGLKYNPDLVLLSWQETDYDDNVRSNLFKLENGKLVPKSKVFLPGVKVQALLFSFPPYRWMGENSHLYSFARERLAGMVKDALMVMKQQKPTTKKEAPRTAPPQTQPAAGVLPSTQPATRPIAPPPLSVPASLTVSLIEAIGAEARSHGATFLILDVPRRIDRVRFVSAFPEKAPGVPFDFPVCSPLEALRAYKGELLFWEKSHYHFTPLGCRIVGETLAQHILKHGLLEKPN